MGSQVQLAAIFGRDPHHSGEDALEARLRRNAVGAQHRRARARLRGPPEVLAGLLDLWRSGCLAIGGQGRGWRLGHLPRFACDLAAGAHPVDLDRLPVEPIVGAVRSGACHVGKRSGRSPPPSHTVVSCRRGVLRPSKPSSVLSASMSSCKCLAACASWQPHVRGRCCVAPARYRRST